MLKQTNRIYLKNPRNIEGIFASIYDTNNDNTKPKCSFLKFLVASFVGHLIIGILLAILKAAVFACRGLSWLCINYFFAVACFSLMWAFISHFNSLIYFVLVAISAYLAQFLALLGLYLDEGFSPHLSKDSSLLLIIFIPLPLMFIHMLIFCYKVKHVVVEAEKI
jgi:hypothetical protein